MFYVGQFRFRLPSNRLLMWTSLLSLLLLNLIPAISMLDGTTDTKIVQDLKEGKRNFLVMGVVKSRFVVMVGNSSANGSPVDDYFVYDMSPNAYTSDNKLYLHNGTALKDKWPVLYEWWKKHIQDQIFRKYMIMSDGGGQHEYMVMIEYAGVAFSYVIDAAALGDKVLANKRYLMNYFWLSNSEPMTAFYREILEDYGQHTTKPPNALGGEWEYNAKRSNFRMCKTVFSGAATYPEANWSEDDGGVYLCKSTDGQLLTQTGACKTPIDWDLLGGFVDGDRVVVFDDTGSNVHVFPKSALVRQNGNKTFKVDKIPMSDFVEAGEPQERVGGGTGHSGLVIGLVVCLVLLLIIGILSFLVFYFCYVKSSPAKPKAGSSNPRGSSSKKRLSTGRGKQTRHGSSKKRETSLKRTKQNRASGQRSSSKRRSSKRIKK